MGDMQKTAIIVPCYNEARRLNPAEFLNFAKTHGFIHFIFVNDGSSDNTIEIIQELCSLDPEQFTCMNFKKNRGKAEAVRRGFLMSMELKFKNIGYWDADLATPLSTIPHFCLALEPDEIILVMGSRVKLLGRKIERRPYRHYIGRVFATCVSIMLGIPVYDTQCGAKIFKNNSDLHHIFSAPFHARWIFDVEILSRLIINWNRSKSELIEKCIIEYPLESWVEIPDSKIKIRDYFIAVFELIKIFIPLFWHRIKLSNR